MELTNTIIRRTMGEYKSPGEGQHIMGLLAVRNCEMRYQDEDPKPGLEFVFRCSADPETGVSHQVRSSLNTKSSLYKTLRKMTKNAVDESTSSTEAFEVVKSLIDHWFDVAVFERKGFARVEDCDIKPAKPGDAPAEPPSVYFASTHQAPIKTKDEDNIPF